MAEKLQMKAPVMFHRVGKAARAWATQEERPARRKSPAAAKEVDQAVPEREQPEAVAGLAAAQAAKALAKDKVIVVQRKAKKPVMRREAMNLQAVELDPATEQKHHRKIPINPQKQRSRKLTKPWW